MTYDRHIADDLSLALIDLSGAMGAARTLEAFEQRYLDGVRSVVPATGYALYLHDPDVRRPRDVAARGVGDYYLARYERIGRPRDPVLEHGLRTGTAVESGALMSPAAWLELAVYREVFRLHEMVSVLLAPVVVDDRLVGTLNFARGPDEPPFGPAERRVAHRLARLVGVATAALQRAMRAERRLAATRTALDACGEAIVVTDLDEGRRDMNASARALVASLEHGEAAVEDAIRRADDAASLGHPPPAVAVRLRGGASAELTARVWRQSDDPSIVHCRLALNGTAPARLPPVIGDALTGREQEVAELAAAGLRDAEIAERLVLSRHTVKQHLSACYAKLGVRSRVELARLALGGDGR